MKLTSFPESGLKADYDRIHDLVNQHGMLRQMLGHGDWSDKTDYKLGLIKFHIASND
ncbi:MAG: hypothetical protein JF606_29815 [Burkholderiales bacterium]|nr:hypothetical protein [Burkholderiales bacterium]